MGKIYYPIGRGFNSFLFSPLFGEDFHFSNGLKPPTRLIITYVVAIGSMGRTVYLPKSTIKNQQFLYPKNHEISKLVFLQIQINPAIHSQTHCAGGYKNDS